MWAYIIFNPTATGLNVVSHCTFCNALFSQVSSPGEDAESHVHGRRLLAALLADQAQ